MSEVMTEKKKMGTGAKVAIGCGSGCLGMILLVAIAIGVAAFYVKGLIDEYETELQSYGFETVQSAQVIQVTEPITEPVLLKGQTVIIQADCTTDVAVLAQLCEVHGKIEGNLYFRGQIITLKSGSEITGNADVKAQVLVNSGEVTGEITGEFQEVDESALQTP